MPGHRSVNKEEPVSMARGNDAVQSASELSRRARQRSEGRSALEVVLTVLHAGVQRCPKVQ